jgi:hypothetical protein
VRATRPGRVSKWTVATPAASRSSIPVGSVAGRAQVAVDSEAAVDVAVVDVAVVAGDDHENDPPAQCDLRLERPRQDWRARLRAACTVC